MIQSAKSSRPSLLPLLREEAGSRGLLWDIPELSLGRVFSLVRDMPYQRASSREPEATLREWRGTCSGKHYLLKSLFEELGCEAVLIMCTHHFTEENTAGFPDDLRMQVSQGPVPDVHTYIRLKAGAGWMDVDATWPLQAKPLGLVVNERFQSGVDMDLACSPIEHFEVPDSEDPQGFKEQLIEAHCGSQMKRRDRFIESLSRWLVESTARV